MQGHVNHVTTLQHATSGISKANLVQASFASQLRFQADMRWMQYMPDNAEQRGHDGC